MARFVRRMTRLMLRTMLWALSCLIVILMIAQIGMACAFLWLGSTGGKAWVYRQVQTALMDSGYTITYRDIFYEDIHGVSVMGLNISDHTGVLATADHLSVDFSIIALMNRQLNLTIGGGNVVLDHLPAAREDKVTEIKEDFRMPDLFFKQISIDRLHINKLTLDQRIMGQTMMLSPDLNADIKIGDKMDIRFGLGIRQVDGTSLAWLPDRLSVQGVLDPVTTKIELEELTVKSAAYNIKGKGVAAIREDQPVDLTLNVLINQLEKFAAGQQGNLMVDANISGNIKTPTLKADGVATIEMLKNKGLEDITFTVDMPDFISQLQGAVSLASVYKDKPVKISADILYSDPQIRISNLTGEAPDLYVSGAVAVDIQTLLAEGDLQIKADDFSAYADLARLEITGKGRASITLGHSQDMQAARITAILDNVLYDTYKVEHIEGTATLDNIANPWPSDADLSVSGLSAGSAMIKTLTASLKQTEGGGNYLLNLNAEGNAGQLFKLSGKADLNNLDQPQPDLSGIDLILKSAGNDIVLTGDLDQQNIDIKAAAKNFAFRGLPFDLPDPLRNLTLSGAVTLNGPLAHPRAGADLRINTGQIKKSVPALNLTILADYKDKALTANMSGTGKGISTLKGRIAIPVDFALQPFRFDMPSSTSLDGDLILSGDSAAMLQDFLPTGLSVSGRVDAQAGIAGTVKSPDVKGMVNIADGQVRDEGTGFSLNEMALSSTFSQSMFVLEKFSGKDDQEGIITGKGQLGINTKKSGQLDFTLKKFQAMHNETADVFLSGALDLQMKDKNFVLAGTVDPEQTTITIPERLQNPIPQLNIVKTGQRSSSKTAQGLSLDIKVDADNRVFVRGWGLDAEFGGTVAIAGTLDKPLMEGNLESIRGRYEEFGRRFTLDHANLRFQGEVPPSPYLDIKADLSASDIVASVLITGPSKSPALSFVSTPSLPQDEVLSRILFGKNMSNISPFQAIQLEQSLQRFSGKGKSGLDPLGALRSATGLDDISVDSSATAGTTVGAGKYVTDKVYIGVQRGQSETSGAANIKVDITPNIAVDSKIGQDAQGGAGVSWHWDY